MPVYQVRNKLSVLIEQTGLKPSQSFLKSVGIGPHYFNKWVKNISQPKIEHAFTLCDLYSIKLEDFFIRVIPNSQEDLEVQKPYLLKEAKRNELKRLQELRLKMTSRYAS